MDTRSIARYSQDARPRCISTAYNYTYITLRYITLHYNAIYKCKRKRKCKYHTYKLDYVYIYILYTCACLCVCLFFLCVCVIMYPHHCTSIHLMCGFQESAEGALISIVPVCFSSFLPPSCCCLVCSVCSSTSGSGLGFNLRPAVITTHVYF
jgi:hypothetical protein